MKRIGLIGTLLLVALLVMGLGIARWSDTLTVEGTVNTGSIQAAFWPIEEWDTEDEGKDYSELTQAVSEDGKTLTVTIVNGYPCIEYYGMFEIWNLGSIPVHIDDVRVVSSTLPPESTIQFAQYTGDQDNPMGADLVPWQLHPAGLHEAVVKVHFPNSAAQNETYTFEVAIDYGQWNMDP